MKKIFYLLATIILLCTPLQTITTRPPQRRHISAIVEKLETLFKSKPSSDLLSDILTLQKILSTKQSNGINEIDLRIKFMHHLQEITTKYQLLSITSAKKNVILFVFFDLAEEGILSYFEYITGRWLLSIELRDVEEKFPQALTKIFGRFFIPYAIGGLLRITNDEQWAKAVASLEKDYKLLSYVLQTTMNSREKRKALFPHS